MRGTILNMCTISSVLQRTSQEDLHCEFKKLQIPFTSVFLSVMTV
jgi:hypothetical protein